MRSKTYYTIRSIARFAFMLAEAIFLMGIVYLVIVSCGAWDALING